MLKKNILSRFSASNAAHVRIRLQRNKLLNARFFDHASLHRLAGGFATAG